MSEVLFFSPQTVMIKPVGSRCNLNCHYCYYLGKQQPGGQPAGKMSKRTLEKMIRQVLVNSPYPVNHFIWHGGEPALAGMDFFKEVLALQKKYCQSGHGFVNMLQSNGTLLDEAWCDFLKENRFLVGLSLDATEKLHNKYRKDYQNQGSYQSVKAALKRLNNVGIEPDLLTTVTMDTALRPEEVYRCLSELKQSWVQFIPIVNFQDHKLTSESVTGKAYGDFLCRILELWLENNGQDFQVQIFSEMRLCLSAMESTVCWMREVCGEVPVVEADGSVYLCDHFVNEKHRLGSLYNQDFKDIWKWPNAFGLQKSNAAGQKCLQCEVFAYCHGGCLKDRISNANGEITNVLCDGLYRFFMEAKQKLKPLVSIDKQL